LVSRQVRRLVETGLLALLLTAAMVLVRVGAPPDSGDTGAWRTPSIATFMTRWTGYRGYMAAAEKNETICYASEETDYERETNHNSRRCIYCFRPDFVV